MVLTLAVLQLYLDYVCSENRYRVLKFANKRKKQEKRVLIKCTLPLTS